MPSISSPRHLRRTAALAAAIAALSLVVSGCAGADEPAADTITVDTLLGEVQLPTEIERVVVLEGRRDLDIVLSLGLPLVGYPYEGPETGIELRLPIETELAAARDAGAEQLFLADEIDIEAIAAAEPTLIVGRFEDIEPIAAELHAIAPVVPVTSHDDGVTWQEDLLLVAAATGTLARAEEIIAEYDARIAEVATEHADAIANVIVAPIGYDLEGSEIEGTRLQSVIFRDLGAVPSAAFAAAIESGAEEFSPEQTLDAHGDAQAILLVADTEEEWDAAQVDPLYLQLPAAQSGTVIRTDKMTHEGGPITALYVLNLIDELYTLAG